MCVKLYLHHVSGDLFISPCCIFCLFTYRLLCYHACLLNKHLTLSVDLGEENPRTIVSGLVKHVPIEEMQVCVKATKEIDILADLPCRKNAFYCMLSETQKGSASLTKIMLP